MFHMNETTDEHRYTQIRTTKPKILQLGRISLTFLTPETRSSQRSLFCEFFSLRPLRLCGEALGCGCADPCASVFIWGFILHNHNERSRSTAARSSSSVAVAVPRFITTRPAA